MYASLTRDTGQPNLIFLDRRRRNPYLRGWLSDRLNKAMSRDNRDRTVNFHSPARPNKFTGWISITIATKRFRPARMEREILRFFLIKKALSLPFHERAREKREDGEQRGLSGEKGKRRKGSFQRRGVRASLRANLKGILKGPPRRICAPADRELRLISRELKFKRALLFFLLLLLLSTSRCDFPCLSLSLSLSLSLLFLLSS